MEFFKKALIIILCVGFNTAQNTYFDIVHKKLGYQMELNLNQTLSNLLLEDVLDPEKILQNLQANGGQLSRKELELFDAIVLEDTSINTTMKETPPAHNYPKVSPLCWNHTQRILIGLAINENWAKEMLDAFGRPGSLLLQNMQTMYIGNFEECQAVKIDDFTGQYCLSKISIATLFNPLTQKKGVELELGICMPSSCSMTDSQNLLNTVIPRLSNNTVNVTGGTCQKREIPYDTKAVVSLSVLSAFAVFVVVGTIYDVITRQLTKNFETFQSNMNDKKAPLSNPPCYKEKDTEQTNGGFEHITSGINDTKANGVFNTSSEIKYKLSAHQTTIDVSAGASKDVHKPGTVGKLLLAFSVYTNGQKILSAKQGGGTLTAINGIRFISMSWVILGHTYGFGFTTASNGYKLYGTLVKRKTFMAIINAEVSVDTFFALSGMLLTYVVLKQLKNGKGRLNWCMFYFHRFWRLTPAYMLIMMIQITLVRYFGNGPRWPQNGTEKNYCKDTWWWNLLYINNFKSAGQECFGHAWYLANDMQFYVISPPILLALYHSKIAGPIVVGILWLLHAIGTGIISAEYKLDVNPMTNGDYFDVYYQKPYTRIGPYLVGMFTGYILFTNKCKCRINKFLAITLWLVFAVSACAVLYGPYEHLNGNKMSNELAALYNALHKTVWGMAVCWVIFACATGYGGFVNTILSWKGFVPLSRLTYCAYLIHPMIMYFYYFSRKHLLFWDDHQVIYEFFGHMVAANVVAFVASLAFESPMMGIEKVIFNRDKKK